MELRTISSPKIVIVGAGFAGASTAWWLRHYGEKDVLVLEREFAPGLKSSGQNAAMARQAANDPVICRLLVEGVRFMTAPPQGFSDRQILRRVGSALMGSESQVRKMADVLGSVLPAGEFRIGTMNDIGAIPYLAQVRAPAVLLTRTDGFVDLEALLDGFLAETAVLTSCALISANRDPAGVGAAGTWGRRAADPAGWSLSTSRGKIRCATLVIASGAHASACAAGAGAAPLPLFPTTRHLFETEIQNDFAREAPFVWDITEECYVRPMSETSALGAAERLIRPASEPPALGAAERLIRPASEPPALGGAERLIRPASETSALGAAGGRLFLSACDQDPYDPAGPLMPDPGKQAILREKLSRAFPSLASVRFHRYWPGARTLTSDGRFVVGPDPKLDHLYWVAGLGGHGVTTAPAVGRIAAESILGLKSPPAEISPARFF